MQYSFLLLAAAAVSSVIAQVRFLSLSSGNSRRITATDIFLQDACVAKCVADKNACQAAPDRNNAACAARFAGCLGYNPYGTGPNATYVEPTACSAGATGSATAVPTPTGDACVAKCQAAADACRVAPQANQSFCSAQFANCLGYNPYGVGPTASYVAPTACSTGATGLPTVTGKPTSGGNGTNPNPTATPTFVPSNGAAGVQGGLVGAVGLVAALFL